MEKAMSKVTKFFKVGVAVSAVTVLLSGCQAWDTVKRTMPWAGQDPQFDVNADANKEVDVKDLNYAAAITTPITLQCQTSSGTWVNKGTGALVRNPDGTPDNINDGGPADRPVYVHAFGTPTSSSCKVRQVVNSTWKTTSLYAYSKTQNYSTYRVVASDGTVGPVFTESEWTCFLNHSSPDFWARTFACNTDPGTTFEILVDETIARTAQTHKVRVKYTKGEWQCGMNVYWDGTKIGIIGDFNGGVFEVKAPASYSLGDHVVGIETLDCLKWNDNVDYGYDFKVQVKVDGTVAKAVPGYFYPSPSVSAVQNFTTNLRLN
jgi:hypothetical protein